MKKRRKNKGQSIQIIDLNIRKTITTKNIEKTIFVRPKGVPKRNEFANDVEGKLAYKAAKKEFWEKNPKIEKKIKRVKKIINYDIDSDINKILDDPKRAAQINTIKSTIIRYNCIENKPDGYFMAVVNEKEKVELKPTKKITVVSSISLNKIKYLTRELNHNLPTNTKIEKAIKLKRKQEGA